MANRSPSFRVVAAGLLCATALSIGWGTPVRAEWQQFYTDDGVPNDIIYKIFDDPQGRIWFFANYGLKVYDGLQWTPPQIPCASEAAILGPDARRNLWLARYVDSDLPIETIRYDGERCTAYTAPMPPGEQPRSALEDRQGRIWIGTYTHGVYRLDGTQWTRFPTRADGVPFDDARVLYEDSKGRVWIGTFYGVSVVSGDVVTSYYLSDGLSSEFIDTIVEDHSGNIWVGTDYGGACRFDGSAWKAFPDVNGDQGWDFVRSMAVDSSGFVWAGTDAGASRWDGATWTSYTEADGVAGSSVFALFVDRQGNVWMGGRPNTATNRSAVCRYDGVSWRNFTTSDGLAGYQINLVREAPNGDVWIVTGFDGVSRYRPRDGSWTTYNVQSGLGTNAPRDLFVDHLGRVWAACFGSGLSLYDSTSNRWSTLTPSDGLPDSRLVKIAEDGTGMLWLGSYSGVARYDPETHAWRDFAGEAALPGTVQALLVDRSGQVWVGTEGGIARYDGASWRIYHDQNSGGSAVEDPSGILWFGSGAGLRRYDPATDQWSLVEPLPYPESGVGLLVVDHQGIIWCQTGSGITRYDGESFTPLKLESGLTIPGLSAICVDHLDRLWLGSLYLDIGLYLHNPDRVPPRPVLFAQPPATLGGRGITFSFVAAHGESRGVAFSYRMDDEAWSSWSPIGNAPIQNLTDGPHRFQVRGRDRMGVVTPEPTATTFEVDATPPAPVISSPGFGQAVRGSAAVLGSAADSRFASFVLFARRAGAAAWDTLAVSSLPVSNDTLAVWLTAGMPDDSYEIRLSVADTLGLTASAQVSVIVDNQAPFLAQTSPARVTAAAGGHVYTTSAEAHLYLPPLALSQDATVTVAALDTALVPASLPDGALRLLPGFELSWPPAHLGKTATFDLALGSAGAAALYFQEGAAWSRLGGTRDGNGRLAAPIVVPGRYAVFAEAVTPASGGGLLQLSLSPRVFSPAGRYATSDIAIAFTLGRAGAATVKIYNRAGRLIREVASGQSFGAGANLVRWDGKDREGEVVESGLYLVSVEALDQTRTATLAVVR